MAGTFHVVLLYLLLASLLAQGHVQGSASGNKVRTTFYHEVRFHCGMFSKEYPSQLRGKSECCTKGR